MDPPTFTIFVEASRRQRSEHALRAIGFGRTEIKKRMPGKENAVPACTAYGTAGIYRRVACTRTIPAMSPGKCDHRQTGGVPWAQRSLR